MEHGLSEGTPGAHGQDAVEERSEWNVAIADADMQMDHDKQYKYVELALRRWELRRAKILEGEARVRESDPEKLGAYVSTGGREQLNLDALFLQQACRKLDVGRMERDLQHAQEALDRTSPVPGSRGEDASAKWSRTVRGAPRLEVPTASQAVSMFDPSFWTSFDPKSFPYGDGVYGLQRDAVLTFDEWGQCLLQRDELEYDSIFDNRASATPSSPTGCVGGPLPGDFWADGASVQDCSEDCYQRVSVFVRKYFPNWSGGNEMDFNDVLLEILNAVEEHIDSEAELVAANNVMGQVLRRMVVAQELRSVHRDGCDMLSSSGTTRSAGATPDSDPLPRWRSARDLQTVMYCLWRRRAYIRSGRLFAKKRKWHDALRDIGKLKAQEMYMTCEILGKGAGMKEALSNPEVPERVKRAMKHLLLCMSSVVGSNAHRTTLRHINSSYRLLFGPPLVFTTPNFADVCSPLLNLMYRGEPVGSWRVLEEHAPAMPSTEEMLRRVARDPVSQALFFDLMVKLFLEHVLGVDMQQRHADGVASSGGLGLFGCVLAFFGPVETQGRGGLHPHMHVWVLNPVDANLLDKLRSGDCDAELIEKLQRWRDAVLEKVATIQFDSVEEFGRQLGLVGADQLPSVPFSERQHKNSRTAEEYGVCEDEEDDLPIKPAPASAPKVLSSEYGPLKGGLSISRRGRGGCAHMCLRRLPSSTHTRLVGISVRVARRR